MNLRVIVGIVLLGALVVFSIVTAEGARVLHFVDPVTIILVVGGTVLFMLVNFPLSEIKSSVSVALSRKSGHSAEACNRAVTLFESAGRAALMLGVLFVFVGLGIILRNLSDPSVLGPAISVALLSVMYAVILAEFLFQSLKIQCLRKLSANATEPVKLDPGGSSQGLILSMFLILLGLLPFVIVMVVMFG